MPDFQTIHFPYHKVNVKFADFPTIVAVMLSLLPLFVFVVIGTFTPGGATTLATASGAHFGYRRSLPMIAGIALGLGSMAAAGALGLAGMILAIPGLSLVMKVIGTAYLLWLAFQTARLGAPHLKMNMARPTSLPGAVFIVWHNPKAWAMSLGASSAFASLFDNVAHLALAFGCAFFVSAIASLSLWCVAGLVLARVLKSERHWHILNTILGAILVISVFEMWAQ